jgi:hypothetical protein
VAQGVSGGEGSVVDDDLKLIGYIFGAIMLFMVLLVGGAVHNDYRKGQVGIECVRAGGSWNDGVCISREPIK